VSHQRYKCWEPDNQDEPDGRWFEDCAASYAAEQFARVYHEENACDIRGDDIPVSVRDEAGVRHEFMVAVDFSPTFYAVERDDV
jgi:hypothetical protein